MVAGGLFLAAYFITLGHEGGYVDDPDDLGGATNMGITEEVAREHGITEVATIEEEEAQTIYHSDYWSPLYLDTIGSRDSSLAFILFDFGVNAGTGRAAMALQRCLNAANREGNSWQDIPVDGIIGQQTLNAFHRYNADSQLFTCVQAVRSYHYLNIIEKRPVNEKYFYGWFKRVTL